jgi:hypothetical protein
VQCAAATVARCMKGGRVSGKAVNVNTGWCIFLTKVNQSVAWKCRVRLVVYNCSPFLSLKHVLIFCYAWCFIFIFFLVMTGRLAFVFLNKHVVIVHGSCICRLFTFI